MSRARSAPLCAIAVDRKARVDEEEDVAEAHRSKSHSHAHDDDHDNDKAHSSASAGSTTATAVGDSRSRRHTAQDGRKGQEDARRGPLRRGPRNIEAASTGENDKQRATKRAKGSGRRKDNTASDSASNLDAMIAERRAQVAKDAGLAGDFGGGEGDAESNFMFERAMAADADAEVEAELVGKGEQEVKRTWMTRRWRKRASFVTRTVQIWAFLFHVLLKLLRQKLVQRDEARMSARRRKLGKYLCQAFLKLGPTFIKIGQVCSLCFFDLHFRPPLCNNYEHFTIHTIIMS